MRFLWALVAGLAATAFVPLIAVFIPYAWFHVYFHQSPPNTSHPHVKEALVSLQTTYFATSCLLPPLSFIPFLCDPQAEANLTEAQSGSTLFRLAVDQGVFYDSVTHNIPAMNDFSLLSDLDNAVDITLSYDSLLLLLQDGAREITGVGDVPLFLNVQRTSRVALRAMYRVVLHAELSIARLLFVQTIALSGLTTLEWAFPFGQVGREMPVRFDWLTKISLTSTSESVHWMRVELQHALFACSTLEDSLATLDASGVHCSLPTEIDICAKAAPLLLGRRALQPLVARLTDLSAELDNWEKTVLAGNFDTSDGARDHLTIAIPILQTHQSGLQEKMLRIQKARLFVEALLGFS